MLKSWLFRSLVTRAARAYGFLDPIGLLAKMRGFAQPSEVAEPIELLRAGMLFHARGLVNTKAIQNNLDWVWPYWVERQFNPADDAFIPRAFSFSHINLTHRNWTAAGLPDIPYYPIVDPRGLVTPLFDGWSLDFWFLPADGSAPIFPSKLAGFTQQLALESDNLHVRSTASRDNVSILTDVTLRLEAGAPVAHIRAEVHGGAGGQLIVALRPYNPEGISFIDTAAITDEGRAWLVNGHHPVRFNAQPVRNLLSVYKDGDASHRLTEAASVSASAQSVKCPVGMCTGAAFFPVNAHPDGALEVRIPIHDELDPKKPLHYENTQPWAEAVTPLATLRVPDARVQRLYDLACANLILHSPGEVYPGPYTYKRFWFRDAAFVLNALVTLGAVDRTRRALKEFAPRQRRDGYFLSQEGEWDSNGEALWMYHRFSVLSGEKLPEASLKAVAAGGRWIGKKRLPRDPEKLESGLLPAGFSAEHLGPNDFYYWDDFWGVAGLRCAADLIKAEQPGLAAEFVKEADDFLATIERSFPAGPQRRFPGAIPASPKRRMDSGAVGSLVADYPLQLFPAGDPRIAKTADYLAQHSSHAGGFFQNMIHSGINPYLTLHMAQVRLRAGDLKAGWDLIDTVIRLASPTGQWPEAIHPRTGGGCMGDGEHIWAAAEWVMVLRNCFVREETDTIVLAAGIPSAWLASKDGLAFGPTLTPWGPVSVRLDSAGEETRLTLDAPWRGEAPRLEFRLPGHKPVTIERPDHIKEFVLKKLPSFASSSNTTDSGATVPGPAASV